MMTPRQTTHAAWLLVLQGLACMAVLGGGIGPDSLIGFAWDVLIHV
jgi:hypothetical protein